VESLLASFQLHVLFFVFDLEGPLVHQSSISMQWLLFVSSFDPEFFYLQQQSRHKATDHETWFY